MAEEIKIRTVDPMENSILFKRKADRGLRFNMPKLCIVTVINLDYMLNKIKESYST